MLVQCEARDIEVHIAGAFQTGVQCIADCQPFRCGTQTIILPFTNFPCTSTAFCSAKQSDHLTTVATIQAGRLR